MSKAEPVRIGLFFGSTNGNTRRVAEQIASLLEADGWATVELLDVAEYYLDEMADFDLVLLGVPTWNTGQMQRDWQSVFDEFDTLDLSGRHVALFGLGDQRGYPDTFADAMAYFADKVQERGALLIGAWPAEGYAFRSSWALRPDGHFVGLVLDEETQAEQTAMRVQAWTDLLRSDYASLRSGISAAGTAGIYAAGTAGNSAAGAADKQ